MNKYFIKKIILKKIIIIEKQFFDSFVTKLEFNNILDKIISMSLGSILLDVAIKQKFKAKKIIEIQGPNFNSKLILVLNIILEVQKNEGIIVFIDIDQTLDTCYIKKSGIIIEKLFIIQPNNINRGLKILNILIKTGIIHFLIINSNNIFKSYSINSNFNNKNIKQLLLTILQNDISILFISQLYTNTFFQQLRFKFKSIISYNYSFIRLNIHKNSYLKKNKKIIGNKIIINIMNKKIISHYKLIELDILYKYGILREFEIIKLGMRSNILKKNKEGIIYNGNILGKNYNSIYIYMKKNNKITKKIEIELLNYFYKKIKSRKLNFLYI